MSKKIYDERQLIERGKAFQYAFYAVIISNVIIYILSGFLDINLTNDTLFLLNVVIPITTYVVSMICKNAYDGTKKFGEELNVCNLGGCGVGLILTKLPIITLRNILLVQDKTITDTAGVLFTGTMMIVVFSVYWIKRYIDKNKYVDS